MSFCALTLHCDLKEKIELTEKHGVTDVITKNIFFLAVLDRIPLLVSLDGHVPVIIRKVGDMSH